MKRVMSVLLVATLCAVSGHPAASAETSPAPAADPASTAPLSPYDPARYTDLYTNPDGPVTGATYIFNPTVNWRSRMAFDFAQLRKAGVNTIGFYNLVQMTDADRDALFTELERNRQKAVVRIEWYDRKTFAFDKAGTHSDADRVLRYHNSDDRTHGYTALLDYLIRRERLHNIVYFAVNMPVDDGMVADKFVTDQYRDGRTNPIWAASQPPYLDHLLAGLRAILGGSDRAKLYPSVFYGWDQTYPTPSYADIAHPADGYFFNNYSYPAAGPADETSGVSERLNLPRLQRAMDLLIGQYPTQPKIIEYGFHTADFNGGVIPNQTAGLVRTVAAKRRALAETTAYYATGSSNGIGFNVRGTLYFAGNLFKPEGVPPALMDWALAIPVTRAEAEDPWVTQFYRGGTPIPATPGADPNASGGQAVSLASSGEVMAFTNLTGANIAEIRYRAARQTDVQVSVNGATPRTVRLPATTSWRTLTVNLDVPLQGTVTVRGAGTPVEIDWLGSVAHNEAELATANGVTPVATPGASRGTAMTMPAGRASTLKIDRVRGGTQVRIRYAAAAPVTIRLSFGAASTTLDLPATGGATTFANRTVPADIRPGSPLTLRRDPGAGDVAVDYLAIDGLYEAEFSGALYNGAYAVAVPTASEGALATSFDVVGSSVVFSAVVGGSRLTFRYASYRKASMTVILNEEKYPIAFPNTEGVLTQATLPLAIPAGATVIVERGPADAALGLSIDWMSVSG